MHESGLVQDIIEHIVEYVGEEILGGRAKKVKKISLRIGNFSGVDIEALKLALEIALSEQTSHKLLFSGVEIEIEKEKAEADCTACGTNFEPTDFPACCPRCFSLRVELKNGAHVLINQIELEIED